MAIGGNSAELKVNLVFDNSKAAAALQTSLSGLTRNTQNFNKNPIIAKNFTQPLGKITGSANEFTKSLEASNARVLAFGASAGAIFAVQKAMSELVKATISVEQALTDINVLLNASDKQFKKFSDGLFDVARKTGTAFASVAESANEFARQGLSVEDTLKRTNAALALSKLGMMDSVNATESLTAALNTFKGEVTDAEVVVNKLAQVDAKFAVSSKDLAEAIKRTGASAQSASVSFEELLAAVTVTQERTARGGAVIGNAFKTIFTRIQRPEVLNQLEMVGVQVRNTSGQVLPAIQILKQYGAVYDKLTPALQSNTAQLIAGGRQINILKSLLPELASGTGKFDSALKVANETTTEATDRLKILTSTTQGTLNAVTANLTKTAAEIGSLSIKPAIDNILKGLNTITTLVGPSNFFGLGETIGKGVYEGIGKVLSGPGIILLATVLAKLGGNLLSFVRTSGAQFLGLNKQAEEQARTQSIIGNILMQRPAVMQKILSGQISQNDAAKVFSNELRNAEFHYAKLNELASSLAAKQRLFSGPSKGRGGGKAEGLIPNFVPNFATDDVEAERQAATQGGYRAGQIRRMNVPGMGGVTYNGKETVKEFPGMQQPAIMPPALSQAGKDYRGKFKDTIGFDPYNSARGFIPNFNLGKISEADILGSGDESLKKEYLNQKRDGTTRSALKAVKGNKRFGSSLQNILGSGAPSTRRAADATTAKYKKEAIQGGEIDIAGRIGLLSMFGKDRHNETTQTSLGQLSAFTEVIDAARATDSTGRNADILSAAKVTFKNVQVRSLEKAGSDLGQDKNEVYEKFRKSLNKNMLPVLAKVGADSITPILGNQSPKLDEIKKKLKTSSHSILPPGSEGDIFEQVIKLATKSPKAFVSSLGDDFRAPFDFEEDGQAGYQFRKQFFNKKGFDMKALVKADAKRTGDDKNVRSLIKKSYNQAILAEESDERELMRQFDLPYSGSRVTVRDEGTGKKVGPIKNTKLKKAAGLIPNFSLKGISNAIQREDRSGVRRDKVRVGYDRRLAASGGIGVYNTDEGSLGNAINMHMSAGRNKSQIQRQGKADGHVPNFAEAYRPGMAINTKFSDSLVKSTKALSQNTEKITKETGSRDRGIGSMIAMSLIGGQMSSFGEKLKESESSLEKFAGSALNYAGIFAMWGPTTQTVLQMLQVKGDTLGQQFGTLVASVTASSAAFRKNTIASALNTTLMGSGSMTAGVAAGGAAGKFATGVKGAKSLFSKGAAMQGPLLGGGQMGGRMGGISNVANKAGGIVGKLAKGLQFLGKAARFISGPIGIAITLLTTLGAAFDHFSGYNAATEAFEKSQKQLKLSIESSKNKFEGLDRVLTSLGGTTKAYADAVKSGNKEEQKRLKEKIKADITDAVSSGGMTGKDANSFLDKLGKDPAGAALEMASRQAELQKQRKKQVSDEGIASSTGELLAQARGGGEETVLLPLINMIQKRITIENAGEVGSIAGKLAKEGDIDGDGLFEKNSDNVKRQSVLFRKLGVSLGMSGAELKSFTIAADKAGVSSFWGDIVNPFDSDLDNLNKAFAFIGTSVEDMAKNTKDIDPAKLKTSTEEQKKHALAQLAAAKSLMATSDALTVYTKSLASNNKILKIQEDGEIKRLDIIRTSNNKIADALSSSYSKVGRDLNKILIDNQTKTLQLQLSADRKGQETQSKILDDFAKKRADAANGMTTEVTAEFENLIKKLKKGVSQGATGSQLSSIVNQSKTSKGFSAGGKVIQIVDDLLKPVMRAFEAEGTDRGNQLKEILVTSKETLKTSRDQLAAQLEGLKNKEKIGFAGGLSGAAVSPDDFLFKFRQAESKTLTGRATGNDQAETQGLVEAVKLLKQFQLTTKMGTINPIGEGMEGLLKTKFEGNIRKTLKGLGIREDSLVNSDGKKTGVEDIADKMVRNLTKPDDKVYTAINDLKLSMEKRLVVEDGGLKVFDKKAVAAIQKSSVGGSPSGGFITKKIGEASSRLSTFGNASSQIAKETASGIEAFDKAIAVLRKNKSDLEGETKLSLSLLNEGVKESTNLDDKIKALDSNEKFLQGQGRELPGYGNTRKKLVDEKNVQAKKNAKLALRYTSSVQKGSTDAKPIAKAILDLEKLRNDVLKKSQEKLITLTNGLLGDLISTVKNSLDPSSFIEKIRQTAGAAFEKEQERIKIEEAREKEIAEQRKLMKGSSEVQANLLPGNIGVNPFIRANIDAQQGSGLLQPQSEIGSIEEKAPKVKNFQAFVKAYQSQIKQFTEANKALGSDGLRGHLVDAASQAQQFADGMKDSGLTLGQALDRLKDTFTEENFEAFQADKTKTNKEKLDSTLAEIERRKAKGQDLTIGEGGSGINLLAQFFSQTSESLKKAASDAPAEAEIDRVKGMSKDINEVIELYSKLGRSGQSTASVQKLLKDFEAIQNNEDSTPKQKIEETQKLFKDTRFPLQEELSKAKVFETLGDKNATSDDKMSAATNQLNKQLKAGEGSTLTGVDKNPINLIDAIAKEQMSALSNLAATGNEIRTSGFITDFSSSVKNIQKEFSDIGDFEGATEATKIMNEAFKSILEDGKVTIKEIQDFNALKRGMSHDTDQSKFNLNMIDQTQLQAEANKRLSESYETAEGTAEALSDALGTRFAYNAMTARKQLSGITLGMVDDLKGGLKGAFGEAIRGTATLREAFASMFDKIADNMLDKSLDMGVDALFGAIGAGARGLAGTPQTAARGGRIRGYNSGGFVDQGSGVRDDVPAMMQGGEYVIRKSSVDKYGRGLFESLNSGGMVGYARGDRVMKNRARSEFVYNDPKSPTSGEWQGGSGLSSFAMMESGSPMIAFQKEREKILERYIKERAAYDEMVAKAKMGFRTAQRKRFQGAISTVAIQAATAGLTHLAAAGAQQASDGPYTQATTENPTSLDDFEFKTPKAALPTYADPWEGKTLETQVRGGQFSFANGGFIKGFAQGGRNRDNIPAMLMGGEYVVNKQSVDKYGVGLFNGLNDGTARGFAEGGPVGASTGGGAPSIANNNFEININITGDGEAETTDASSEGDTTREQEERNEKLGLAVQEAVQLELIDQQRPGGLLYREDRF